MLRKLRHRSYLSVMRQPYRSVVYQAKVDGGRCELCGGKLLDYEGLEDWGASYVKVLGKCHGQEQLVYAPAEGRMLESLEDAAEYAGKVVKKTKWFDPKEAA